MIYCDRIKRLLNEAKIKGSQHIIVDSLSALEQEELKECGFKIKKLTRGWRVYE